MRSNLLDATTEQNADLDPELFKLRATLHVVYTEGLSKHLPVPMIVAKVLAWIRQWAAELLKKQITPYQQLVETLWSQALVVHHTTAWILNT